MHVLQSHVIPLDNDSYIKSHKGLVLHEVAIGKFKTVLFFFSFFFQLPRRRKDSNLDVIVVGTLGSTNQYGFQTLLVAMLST